MRTHAVIPTGLLVSALTLVACSADQPAATAPTMAPSHASAQKSTTFTFSLSCTNADPSTVANVTVVTRTGVAQLAPLSCGDQSAPVSDVKSWQYQITLRSATGNTANDCTSRRPLHKAQSITCAGSDDSAVLTAQ